MSLLPLDERKYDEQHLAAALALARAAVGLASPNPTVGCVLAHGEIVLGEGAHHYDARDHAEIAALKQAASLHHDVRNATAYVTLEPCSHHGRTGPCSDALIAAGIARCVIATVDPNPLVRGKGIAKLRAAGIETLLIEPSHPLAKQARRLNDAFAQFIQWQRPFVTLKAAVSIDGHLAPPPRTRQATQPYWLTGEAARADVQKFRHASDAILTGVGTIIADNPSLTDRSGLSRRRPLMRIVMDTHLRTPPSAQLFPAKDDVLIVCSESASVEAEKALIHQGAEILRLPAGVFGRPGPSAVLQELGERKRFISLLIEGGTHINDTFLQRNLVDRVVLYYADVELGADGVKFAKRWPSPYELQSRLTDMTRDTFPNGTAEDVRIVGYRHDPWIGVE